MKKTAVINWSIEFGPVMLFFVSLGILGQANAGFILSTAVFVAATVAALLTAYIRDKRIAFFPIVAGTFVVVFGICTISFNNPSIFIVKDTVYNGLFALALFTGLAFGTGLLKYLFGSLFDMSDVGWYRLSYRWMIMFLFLAVSNELVFMMYTLHVWVDYKIFATFATTVFGLYQIVLARKYRNPTASAWGLRVDNRAH